MANDITAQFSEFRDFLHDIGLSDSVIENYTMNIWQIDEDFMKKKAGCQSVYQITDRILLKLVIEALPKRYPLWTSRYSIPLDKYMQFLQVLEERNIVDKRSEAFYKYLIDNQISRIDAELYSNLLREPRNIVTMIKSFGVSSVYCIDNENVLNRVITAFSDTDNNRQFCDAVMLYKKWFRLHRREIRQEENNQPTFDLTNLVKINDRESTIARLEAQLAKKDAEISCLKKQIETKSEEPKEPEQRDELRELLTLDAVMQHCNENCTEPSEVKAILDMLTELYQGVTDKRWMDAKKKLRKRITALKNPVHVNNLIMEQNIGHNVENVESGATGIKVMGGNNA